MLRKIMLAVLFCVSVGTAMGLVPPDSPFTFPSQPPAPAPTPTPTPPPLTTPLVLTPGIWYVIDSKIEALVRPHPIGLVKVYEEKGPVTIKGIFIDGTGVVETRKFEGPFLYYLEPTGKGRVEVDVIPAMPKEKLTNKDVGFRTIDVDNGQAPIPPPVPVDDPLTPVLQAAYNAEPATVTETPIPGQPSITYPKGADKTSLAAVLRGMSVAVKDAIVKTGDDNFSLLTNSTQARIGNRLKVQLRPVIGAEFNKILPSGKNAGTIALTDKNKADASALYLRIADLLDKKVK